MPLSDRTLAEMQAGAKQVLRNQGSDEELFTPEYWQTVRNTQERMRALRVWERKGLIHIETIFEPDPLNTNKVKARHKIIHVGENKFEDYDAETAGSWPSEVMITEIALALAAGEHIKNPFDGSW